MSEKILAFSEDYAFLSNFAKAAVRYEDQDYESSESAFQAAKSLDPLKRAMFRHLSPNQAKREGRRMSLRWDWEVVKDQVMLDIVRDKFHRNPELAKKLLATGDAELIEGNTWHDNYWGDCSCPKCKIFNGKNVLGKTLMQVRDELKAEISN